MTELTREQVRANRQKWIDFLKNPMRRKAVGVLDNGFGQRCCLGHGCYALRLQREKTGSVYAYGKWMEECSAPIEFIAAVGLFACNGKSDSGLGLGQWQEDMLVNVNDETDATPQQIGEYLQSVIEGGEDTPFRPLSEYKEGSA